MGLVGTVSGGVAGIVLTQRRADKREQLAWDREREREREQWAREDAARTFEHRREACLEFYVAVKEMARTAYNHSYGLTEPALNEGWQVDAFEKLDRLRFYADQELTSSAAEAYNAAWSWGVYGKYDNPETEDFGSRHERYTRAELEMLALMRDRLSIQEGDLGPLHPGYPWLVAPPAVESD
jgi:hypothetical protein